MVSVLFDTNILIDHFSGVKEATAELERYEDAAITTITWLEVLSGARPDELQDMRDYMSHFTVYDLDSTIADEAAIIHQSARQSGFKVPKSPPYTLRRDAKTDKVTVKTQPPLPTK